MESVLLVIGLVEVIADVASCVVTQVRKENIRSSFMNVKVHIFIAGPILMSGKFRTDNPGKAVEPVAYGGDGNDTPCASVIFSPGIGYEPDGLHIGGGKERQFGSVRHLSPVNVNDWLTLSENLVLAIGIKHSGNILDHVSGLSHVFQTGTLNIQRQSAVFPRNVLAARDNCGVIQHTCVSLHIDCPQVQRRHRDVNGFVPYATDSDKIRFAGELNGKLSTLVTHFTSDKRRIFL